MKFNADKCKVMHVGRKECKETPYSLGQGITNKKLELVNEEKDLGVWFDKFSGHDSHAVAKSNQMLELIKRSFIFIRIFSQ